MKLSFYISLLVLVFVFAPKNAALAQHDSDLEKIVVSLEITKTKLRSDSVDFGIREQDEVLLCNIQPNEWLTDAPRRYPRWHLPNTFRQKVIDAICIDAMKSIPQDLIVSFTAEFNGFEVYESVDDSSILHEFYKALHSYRPSSGRQSSTPIVRIKVRKVSFGFANEGGCMQ